MRTLTLFSILLLGSLLVQAAPRPVSTAELGTYAAHFKGLVAQPSTANTQTRLAQLQRSVLAIQDTGSQMTSQRALKIAEAALNAEKVTGVDATLLLAVARMESDFKDVMRISTSCYSGKGTCMADCGMTQHHIRGSKAYVLRYCKTMKYNRKLAFVKSAQELAHHIRWCRKRANRRWVYPIKRCVLNRYNQGPFYKTRQKCFRNNRCWRRKDKSETWPEYNKSVRPCYRARAKCVSRAAYWIKVSCFEHGARKVVKPKRNCRRCTRLVKIPSFYPVQVPLAFLR